MKDFSICQKKIVNGETWYFYDGDWVLPIDIDKLGDISDNSHYSIEKVTHSGENDHKFASSKEAMIEGCYKFLEIIEEEKKVASDVPGRFIARALYNKELGQDYLNKKGGKVEVYVRLNPLLNKDAKGPWYDQLNPEESKGPSKSLENFEKYFLGKEIHLTQIQISPNSFGSKSYIYHWNYL